MLFRSNDEPAPGMQAYTLPRLYQVREFYAPLHPADNRKNPTVPDFRSATLYWNPRVGTDAAGQATVSFYTSEASGPFRLTLEGISGAGAPGRGTASFRVAAK